MAARLWLGGVLVTLGVLWLLDAVEVLDAGAVTSEWWPLGVIALAVAAAAGQRRLGAGPVLLLGVGVVLLVGRLWDQAVGSLLGPVLALLAGGWLLLQALRRRAPADDSETSRESSFALLGGAETRSRSSHFERADVAAVLGGATLDLREARVQPGARVDALAVFGGVDVIVPEGTRVHLHGLPVFGGYSDSTTANGDLPPDAPTVDVSATAIFGAVEVKSTPD